MLCRGVDIGRWNAGLGAWSIGIAGVPSMLVQSHEVGRVRGGWRTIRWCRAAGADLFRPADEADLVE